MVIIVYFLVFHFSSYFIKTSTYFLKTNESMVFYFMRNVLTSQFSSLFMKINVMRKFMLKGFLLVYHLLFYYTAYFTPCNTVYLYLFIPMQPC